MNTVTHTLNVGDLTFIAKLPKDLVLPPIVIGELLLLPPMNIPLFLMLR